MTCAEIAERGLIERYVAGTLSADEAVALEAHYVACTRCQTELRLALAVRQALSEPAAAAAPRRQARRWIGGLGLALAAGITALIVWRAPGRSSQWRDLGAVPDAPIYLGVEVRGAPARGDSLFAVAMAAYNERRYSASATALRAALAVGTDSAPAEFFLAAALLVQDRAGEAAEAYARVIGLGDTPYLGEAHFYRAKALLRQGQAVAAVAELRAVESSNAVSAWARALADSVESRLRR